MALLIPTGHLSLEICPQPDRANIPPRSPQACSGVAALSLKQPTVVVGRLGGSATLLCTASESVSYIHWYLHQEGSAPRRILMLDMSKSYVQRDGGFSADKITAKKGKESNSCELLVRKLEKRAEGAYYCAAWELTAMLFGPGTLLRATDKNPDEDISPKPTIFLPSIAEVKLHKAGTYVCLLENIFPDVIKIDWKEKNGKTVLESLQGNTMKTKDAYMKYTWLTVQQESMDREHKCIVKRETNKKSVEQEIFFPSINKKDAHVAELNVPSPACEPVTLAGETNQWLLLDLLHLQLMNTSAYYTYVLLLVKSVVYTIIITIGLLGRGALCDNEKSS
uniref:Ig-like domain-containing protein n=1 Tax=Suricata suricatta TaxID=37032 RepID=A0A673U4J6_SURSU